jgi:hypothetical protein
MKLERCAVVGTAGSWVETPWADPGLTVMTLNDGYSMVDPYGKGPQKISEHYDLHPFERMWFRPKEKRIFKEGDIPDGVFVRPAGHIEWLKEQAKTIPVWLKDEPPPGWPVNARRFPFEEVKAFLKARPDQDGYIASSPVQMVAHAMLRGAKEIQIYGIHLATQGEYLKQRPNFEWLLGRAEERGIKIVLPKSCPLLKHSHVYGHEPEPPRADAEAMARMHQAQKELSTLTVKVAQMSRWKSRTAELTRMARLRAVIRDAQMQARHALMTVSEGA